MIDGREHLRFAPEPRQPIRIVGKLRQQHLERHVAVDAAIAGAVDLAHPAAAQQLDDLVVLDRVARREDVRGGLQIERTADLVAEVAGQRAAGLEKAVVAPRLADDRGERVAEGAVVGGCAPDERLALFWRQRERAVEQIVGFRPPAEVQMFFQNYASPSPASSWRSQARALNHSRCAVRTDMPSASAVSSSVRPAKYRHSTIAARLPIRFGELAERQVDLEDPRGVGRGGVARLVEGNHGLFPAALLAGAPPGVVDDDLPHRDRANREEVTAIAPRGPGLVHQPQIGFVDEPARVERLDPAAPPQLDAGEPTQVVVDERYEPIQGARSRRRRGR